VQARLANLPTVWLMANREKPLWGDQVMPDNTAIGETAAQYLLRRGPRQLAYLGTRSGAWYLPIRSLAFVKDKSEWNDTEIVFEISETGGKTELRFTHRGLVPEYDCYESCSNAWGTLINGNLRKLIATGERQPDAFV
jgi:hypothetical protein